jgi:hypothetical protein
VNGLLRRLRLRPRPPGASRAIDVAKLTAVRALDRLRRPRDAEA